MSNLGRSSELKRLLDAAKADRPSAAARANVWATVSKGIAVAGGLSAIAGSATTGLGGAAKALSAGAWFGGSVTIGLAASLLYIGAAPPRPLDRAGAAPTWPSVPPPVQAAPTVVRIPGLHGAEPRVDATGEPTRATADDRGPARLESAAATSHAASFAATPGNAAAKRARAASAVLAGNALAGQPSDLAREAQLVAEARAALAHGDPRAALRRVHATMTVEVRQLVPEEIAVEAQALRALGRRDAAAAIEAELRALFPESALAR